MSHFSFRLLSSGRRGLFAVFPGALLAAAILLQPCRALAQDKIAYANLDLIISLMPETKTIAKDLDTLGRQLAKDLDAKQSAAEAKAKEARDKAAGGAAEKDLAKFRTDLQKMEEDLRKGAENADEQLARKRADALKPVFEKLEKTIEEVAKANGYTFVLNSMDGEGNSIVLYGADGRDITDKILGKMGIPMPKPSAPAATGAKPKEAPKGKSGK